MRSRTPAGAGAEKRSGRPSSHGAAGGQPDALDLPRGGKANFPIQYSMGTKSTATIRTLAAEAGVCPMTVSLALRNHRSISAPVRARLQRLAEVRGYLPDPTI